ncbi:DUF4267 domain-containing protein [Mucilaginibacter pedocola]|uniref:DUF4267 domain-containing protein n=1 Tax=Mucilaginibacter pedocola TaxID=1792845 RepID=A0A1S9PLU1_9SPHI|nr:DUF4267 domain-containing protein [Mucilaginibacter pedocola]OOQ61905.1 hypothetical protein BC343_02250 [Mucilaginibacter pedocola]
METQIKQQTWGRRSVSYWLTLLLALGIIFIGIRFILFPQVGATGYGIVFNDMRDAAYGKIKGIRDIFSGIVLIPLLAMRMRKATAWVFTSTIVVPLGDFFNVLAANGAGDMAHLMIHGITALVMMVNSVLLFRMPVDAKS